MVDGRAGQALIEQRSAELAEVRARHGRGSGAGEQAFHRLVAAYAACGRRIDELRFYEPDETIRFFQGTLQGGSGHVYWQSKNHFKMNSGASRKPVLWWWNHLYGEKPDRVRQVCGEARCINPRHAIIDLERGPKRIYPDHVILGALQVWALRNGHTPSAREWRGPPSATILKQRFGSWDRALKAAGLPPSNYNTPWSAEQGLRAVRLVHERLGRWPSHNDFLRFRDDLRALGLPTAPSTIRRHFGVWADVIAAAKRR